MLLKIQYFELGIFSFNSYVYYLTRGFIASTRAFNLLTRAFNLLTRAFNLATRVFSVLTREFELVTRRFELVTRSFELVTRGFKLVTREFELVTRGFELVTRRFERVTRVLLFHFNNTKVPWKSAFALLYEFEHCYFYVTRDEYIIEAYSEPCQASKMEHFAKIVNGFHPLTLFAKRSMLVV